MPQHGIFVAERLKHLLASGEVDVTVIAPVPWFPVANRLFTRYSQWSRVPREEIFERARVLHPRFLVIPKVGMSLSPALLALRAFPVIRKIHNENRIDVIDAHYFYPDGVAASMIAHWLDIPVTITGRGSDLNLIPRYRFPKRLILRAAERASALATVSESLRQVLTGLGVPESKIRVLPNGVDVDVFRPVRDRKDQVVGERIDKIRLLSVGNLVELKGHDLVIRSLLHLPETFHLSIVGDGPMRSQLRRLSKEIGVESRVHFLGRLSRGDLIKEYNAADLLVLASSREGMANVLLESIACGTPVVATDVGGNKEVVNENVGELVSRRDPDNLATSIQRQISRQLVRANIRRYAESFSWGATTSGQLEMFKSVLKGG